MTRAMYMGVLALALATTASADPLNASEYEAMHRLQAGDHGDQEIMRRCLSAWGEHPFATEGELKARIIESSVRIMGIGQENSDRDITSYPQLILIHPSVNVMTKTTYELLNPNGWYCFDANVTVMGKAVIRSHCAAHVADGRHGVAVGAHTDTSGAVTVLGSTRVEQVGDCAEPSE